MKLKLISFTLIITLCFALIHCNDDPEFASIHGKWQGDKAKFNFNGIPITQNEFNFNLEFKSDGTVTYTKNEVITSGTYTLTGEDLFVSGLEVEGLPVSLSGSYEVKELTANKLEIEGEREGEIEDATYGTISGKVKATFFFNKVNF